MSNTPAIAHTHQAALEAKRVTPNRMLQELYDEIGIGPFKKGENDPFGEL